MAIPAVNAATAVDSRSIDFMTFPMALEEPRNSNALPGCAVNSATAKTNFSFPRNRGASACRC
jgi:hypothetical protein